MVAKAGGQTPFGHSQSLDRHHCHNPDLPAVTHYSPVIPNKYHTSLNNTCKMGLRAWTLPGHFLAIQ
jgi:hypothetical protein